MAIRKRKFNHKRKTPKEKLSEAVGKLRNELWQIRIDETREPIKLVWEYMPPRQIRGNSRAHWTIRHKFTKMFKESAYMRLMEIDPEPMDKIRIKYIAYYSGKPVDEDNLTFGMKPALDALTEYGLIKDDSPEYVKGIEVEYHRVPHKHQVGMIMEITEA